MFSIYNPFVMLQDSQEKYFIILAHCFPTDYFAKLNP